MKKVSLVKNFFVALLVMGFVGLFESSSQAGAAATCTYTPGGGPYPLATLTFKNNLIVTGSNVSVIGGVAVGSVQKVAVRAADSAGRCVEYTTYSISAKGVSLPNGTILAVTSNHFVPVLDFTTGLPLFVTVVNGSISASFKARGGQTTSRNWLDLVNSAGTSVLNIP